MSTNDQCALGPDGKLLDESNIVWVNDPDDPNPIAPAVAPTHPFYTGRSAPVVTVAGIHRSAHVPKPSKRVLDADNAERAEGSKRPRGSQPAIIESDPEDDEDPEDIDGPGETTDGDDAGNDTDMDSEIADVEAAEEAYAATKAMGDRDREALSNRPKLDRTADVRTIFKRDKGHVNPDSGAVKDGHWCTICLSTGVSKQNCFFLGSVTSLRNHITRNIGHVKMYTERCKKLGIVVNERVYAKSESLESISGPKQGTLYGSISRSPRIPVFTTDGLLDYIVELIVSEDEAFQLIDKKPFRRLFTYLRPSLKERVIPHRTKLRYEILSRAKVIQNRISVVLKDLPGKVSFTFDTWTSEAGDPYLSMTGHYISAPIEKPQEWELKSELLGFTHIEGNHSGSNLGNILVCTIDRYGIRRKTGWFTADNASNNFSAVKEAGRQLKPELPDWDPKQHYVRSVQVQTLCEPEPNAIEPEPRVQFKVQPIL